MLRAKQWIKNGFIVIPLIFSGNFLDGSAWWTCLWVVAGFSLLDSAVYIVNDILDNSQDQLHPRKAGRPIAAGRVQPFAAGGISALCAAIGLAVLCMINPALLRLALLYVLLQAVYNFTTKRQAVLDVVTIALGFQVRIWLGAMAIGVIPSLWLQMCVLLLTLFLGFAKRRHEIFFLGAKAVQHRAALGSYTVCFLDQMIMVSAVLVVVFYWLYTISGEVGAGISSHGLLYSICFVIFGMSRYLYLVHVKKLGADPGEVLLSDVPLLTDVVLWIVFVMGVIFISKGF